MTTPMLRTRADSSASGRHSIGSLDASVSADVAPSLHDDGGALDALWRFEEAHHFLLEQQLAVSHAAFVDDLYAAIEAARDALEQQSVRVLAVLHDKDARIRALEDAAPTADIGVQVEMRRRRHDQAIQCERETRAEGDALWRKVSEQEEQIDVLLDELERLQNEKKETESRDVGVQAGCQVEVKATQTTSDGAKKAKAIQTDNVGDEAAPRTEQLLVALQRQLEAAERDNAALRVAFERQQHTAKAVVDDEAMDAIEIQLDNAIQRIEATSQCRLSPLVLASVSVTASCLDMEHQLQAAELERAALEDGILAMRAAFTNVSGRDSACIISRAGRETRSHPSSTTCTNVTCVHNLRRLLQQVKTQRKSQSQRDTKLLRSELRHALRGRRDDEAAALVAQVVAEWMGWEATHVEEIQNLRRAHAVHIESQAARFARLVDECYLLSQQNTELETKVRRLSKQQVHPSGAKELHDKSTAFPTGTAIVDYDRRVLELEQALLLKQDQLDVANRAIQAMAAGNLPHTVQFVDEGPSTRAISRLESAPLSTTTKRQIARLSVELQALKERDSRRFQPADTSQHAVVEYFRLEKECLRLQHRLKEKEDRVEQLEALCDQLEQTAPATYLKKESQKTLQLIAEVVAKEEKSANPGSAFQVNPIERYYVRLVEQRNEELWLEMSKARTRIACLEQEVERLSSPLNVAKNEGHTKLMRELAVRIEEYHRNALDAFQRWQRHSQPGQNPTRLFGNDRSGIESELTATAYDALLRHYEILSLQLRLFQSVRVHPAAQTTTTASMSHRWYLLEKIHVLEDRLLEAQCCFNCGDVIPKKRMIKTTSVGTSTSVSATTDATTQVSSRDAQRQLSSKAVQVDPNTSPFHTQESQPQLSTRQGEAATLIAPMVNDEPRDASDLSLQEIQRQLEASLVRIDKLTKQKEKLKERLEEAKRTNQRYVTEQESLRSQLAEVSSLNASLSSQLLHSRQAEKPSDTKSTGLYGDVADKVAEMENALAVMERENAELVRQRCESKERCFQLERNRDEAKQRADKLDEELRSIEDRAAEARNGHLEEYMAKVNQSLASIARDKERLARENQELHGKLEQIERAKALKEAMGTRTCGTETDTTLENDRLLQLPEHQDLEMRVVMLQNELETERQTCDELRVARDTELREKAKTRETERQAIGEEKATLQRLLADISSSHEQLQREFMELQAASMEAREEAEKRIQFLTACVEECSRLVDASGPNDDVVTSRDIYDTIVTLSKKVSASPSTLTPRKGKSPHAVKTQDKKMAVKASLEPTSVQERGEESPAIQLHSQLQAETWRVRVAKLEASLRAVSLKNKTFEDMVDHLEVQMDGLKDEVKDRMTRESTLLAKQGQLKVEITTLKAQNGTLTSRLAEACGELKRTQDASKGTDGEVARLRTALQRKTELLTRQKTKGDDMQKALDQASKRIAHLEASEKQLAVAQLKLKDQALQFQELRQQSTVTRDANFELRAQADKQKEQVSELQSRVKALRLDNGLLRDQLRELKKAIREEAETTYKSQASDTAAAAAAVMGDGNTPTNLTPSAAVEMLATQVKTLKRRVLQKQDVILAYKTKLAELDAELTLQRTKLFDLSQAYRQFQQSQREKELSMVQSATQLKDDLELAVANKAEQLDGLRASIFDACEVFVQCAPPRAKSPANSSSGSSSASPTWPDDLDVRSDPDDQLLQELRQYADLSPADLVDLRITTAKNKNKSHRLDRAYAIHTMQQRGARVLRDLEHALEATPHDCRREICDVLEFLCGARSK